jgi:hypothetical protein
MSKVIQWYVSDIPNPHIDKHLSNYFPWKKLQTMSVLQTIREMDDNKSEDEIGRYSFRSDPEWHSWVDFYTQTEVRFINKDFRNYDPKDINIFPIRLVANDDQVFTYKNLCPFGNLPNETIEWLQKHKDCAIVFHDAHEAKAVSSRDFVTIPSLIVKRKEFKLENRFVFLDSHANTKSIYENSVYNIPDWLVFLSCSHWMQFVSYTMTKKHINEIIRLSKRKPLFKKGRFLCYSGRFRPARYTYLSKLQKIVQPEHLWMKISKPTDMVDPEVEIKEIMQYHQAYQQRLFKRSHYHRTDIENMIELYHKLPINTFPKEIQEGNIDYHHLKWFWLPNPTHYSRAFIDISCETYNEREGPYHNDLFITEKICKPILARRPFITSANPGLYDELHRLGFKTFDRWWNEDFAEEGDVKIHIEKIMRVIRRIDNMSIQECDTMWEEMQDTLDYNQELYLYYANRAPRFWITELKKVRGKKLI